MTTQKVFKRRVRARMAKTGEAYTAARSQLLGRSPEAEPDTTAAHVAGPDSAGGSPDGDAPAAPRLDGDAPARDPVDPVLLPTTDDAVLRATGRAYTAWFAELDAAGAAEQGHTQIAAWLADERGVPGWWAQAITVAYERARGLRATNQVAGGFQVTASRTIAAGAPRVLAAFTDDARRERWLPGIALGRRPTTAATTARFDWPDPPSRLVVYLAPKNDGRTVLSLAHERLPHASAAAALKAMWRTRLDALRAILEAVDPAP